MSPIKVLYFTGNGVPTARELAEIARLQTRFASVFVRRGDVAADASYGSGAEELSAEITAGTCVLAGTNIPAAYSGTSGAITLTVPSPANPDQFKLYPLALALDASDVDVKNLVAIKANINLRTGLAEVADLAANPMVTYASSDASKATVSSVGLVTAVAAGSTTITATLTSGTQVTGGAVEADDDIYTKVAHGYQTGEQVRLVSLTGGTGLTAGNDYYFHKLSADTGYFCSSLANALAGIPVAVTLDASAVVTSLTAGLSVTGGAVAAVGDVYTKAAHGFGTGQALKLVSLTNGTGLTAGTTYYFTKLTDDTGYLCATLADAINAVPVPVNVTVDATAVVLAPAPLTSTCAVTVAA